MRLQFLAPFALLAWLFGASAAPRPAYDFVIRGGTIYDGSGGAPYVGDVAISGDRIVAVGRVAGRGAREVDAHGLAVAPGFINMLSWSNESLIQDPRSQSEIRQGVTLEVMGEGWSMGPLNPEMKRLALARQSDIHYPISLDDARRISRFPPASRHRAQRRELRRRDHGAHPRARRGRRRSQPGPARPDAGPGPPGDGRRRDGRRQRAHVRAGQFRRDRRAGRPGQRGRRAAAACISATCAPKATTSCPRSTS